MAKFNYEVGIFIIVYHILFIISLPLYLYFFTPSLGLILLTVTLSILCNLSITTGYHRYFSHKSYRTNKIVEATLLFFSTLAVQGSALIWSHDHRVHHEHLDTEQDPYSIKQGFFHAHMGWLFTKRKPHDPALVQDLLQNKYVAFQHTHYVKLMIAANIVLVSIGGLIFQDFIGAFVLLFLTRLFFCHHSTWSINSLAHLWGSKPYSKEQSSVNNFIVGVITFGEGYHNYHHAFATDYRNGVRWWQYDPTKLLIWTLSKFSLTKGLKRIDKTIINKRILLEDKRILLNKLKLYSSEKIHHVEQEITILADKLSNKLSDLNKAKQEYIALKTQPHKEKVIATKYKLRCLKKSIRLDFKAWGKLCTKVLKRSPYPSQPS